MWRPMRLQYPPIHLLVWDVSLIFPPGPNPRTHDGVGEDAHVGAAFEVTTILFPR